MTDISTLRPYQKRVNLTIKVIEINEPREVTSRLDDTEHQVTEALVADITGSVLLTLWDKDIEKIEVEKSYQIENGYTSLFKKSLRLNIGRFGKLEESEDIGEVNKENNISEKELE